MRCGAPYPSCRLGLCRLRRPTAADAAGGGEPHPRLLHANLDGAFYTVAKLPVDDAKKFCAWCLSDFRYTDENIASLISSGHVAEVKAETIMMAPAAGFYTN